MNVTRLAPSPTGALHLGNARTFLINWCLARRNGWRIVLRIEDLDGPRVKIGADTELLEELRWLGLDWDSGPHRQSTNADRYRHAVDTLVKFGVAYPCTCSRGEIELAASAPHAADGSSVYPGACRGRYASVQEARDATGRQPCIRFQVPDDASAIVRWVDAFRGRQEIDARKLGDFVIVKNDGTAGYQLAVVVDDAAMGVTQIVRGDDLVESTPRQVLIYNALGFQPRLPIYTHLPLVTGSDGRRLAKRHGDTRLSYYRALGVSPERVLALLARWCGLNDCGDECTPAHLRDCIDLQAISRRPITFQPQNDEFLRARLQ